MAKSAAVIGNNPAAIQAALTLVQLGFEVKVISDAMSLSFMQWALSLINCLSSELHLIFIIIAYLCINKVVICVYNIIVVLTPILLEIH